MTEFQSSPNQGDPNRDRTDQVERGAAEERSGAPLTPTEEEVSQPPQERGGEGTERTTPLPS